MNEIAEAAAWVALAEEDYALARSALRRRTPLIYGATFHAQQCAEKYLKAILVQWGQAFPRTHDLIALCDLCAHQGIAIPVEQDAIQRLVAYAVQVRYPGEAPILEEARSALETARAIRYFARKLLGLAR